jgi:FkbM family methyltransferase
MSETLVGSNDVQLAHLEPGAAQRVLMTISCRDADGLPKVEGAGDVFERDGVRLQRMHNGVVIEEGCYYGPWMTEVIRGLKGHHEPQEEAVFHDVLERILATDRDPTMIELGSFWSYYSLWFLDRMPAGRIVAMEPDPAYLEVGRRNFALNGRSGLFVPGAVGPAPNEDMEFRTESTGQVVTVPMHDLGSLMRVSGLERVSLLMVDIQGAETVLLERAVEDLKAGRVRFLILSTHHHSISGQALTHQAALALLESCGAHVIAEHSVGESYSGDGLIAVSFDEADADFSIEISHARQKESLFGELEYDLASVMQERDIATARLDESETEMARLAADRDRLARECEAIQATKLWRWSRVPRSAYGRLKRSIRK